MLSGNLRIGANVKRNALLLASVASVMLLLGVVIGRGFQSHSQTASGGPLRQDSGQRTRPSPEAIIAPHLEWAEQECDRVLDEHLRAIARFFADAKAGTPTFAGEALSFGSKMRLVADYVPFTRGGRHEGFIRRKFEEHVFKSDDLGTAVKQVVSGYLKQIESIESLALVRIRADIADLTDPNALPQFDQKEWKAEYDKALKRAISATSSELSWDVATELVSVVTGEVLAQVAVQLGVSAGLLGAGGASSWATFGVGLVVGLIVDQAVSWVWDWYADPRGNLAADLSKKLDEMQSLIVDGSEGVQGLRQRLHELSRQRATLRRSAILSVLKAE